MSKNFRSSPLASTSLISKLCRSGERMRMTTRALLS
jgi:hypothetical protein